MRPLSILNVAYPFAPVGAQAVGGAEQVLSSVERYVHAAGERSIVLACEGSSAAGELHTVPLPDGPLDEAKRDAARARYRERLHALIEGREIDVVHLHGLDFHAYLPESVPTVVTLHLPLSFYAPEALASLPPNVHPCCVSATQRRAAPAGLRLLADIENGVALDAFSPRADVSDYVLVLGRICPEKGVHLALEAAHRSGVPAVVAGRVYPYPEHVAYFEREVRPRLDAKRRYVGAVGMPEKAALLARARCVVVPSLVDETSSLVSMEALASGTPVVALRRGALPDVVEDGVTGFVVDTPEELVDAVRNVSRLDRARCRVAAEARFSEQAMCERYLARYRSLADPDERGASRPRSGRAARVDVREIASASSLAALEPAWRALWERCPDASVFQRPEWQLPYVEQLLRGSLRALAFERDRELVGLCPFFSWTREEACALSLLGAGISDYQDVLFEPAHREASLRALEEWLAGGEIDACMFSELRPGSPLLALSPRTAAADRFEPQEVCPTLELEPGRSLSTQLSKHLSQNLRTARHNAARGGLSIEPVSAENLQAFRSALMTLHAARRASFEGEGCFATPSLEPFHALAIPRLFASGFLRMYALRLADGTLGGVIYALQDRDVLRFYQHGFDPALGRYSPGTLLLSHAVERAIAEGARTIDFLRGAETYKYRWGAVDRFRLTRRTLELTRSRGGRA